MQKSKAQVKSQKLPTVTPYDKGPRDFFRGSTGFFNKGLAVPKGRSFIGMRRGSR